MTTEPPEAPRRLRLGGVGARWVRLVWAAPAPAPASRLSFTALYTALHALPAAEARSNAVNLTLHTHDDR